MKWMYCCHNCNYSSDSNSNYKKHLKTKKHQLNTSNKKIITYTCDFCQNGYTSQASKSKHQNKCLLQKYKLLEHQLQIKNKILKEKDENIIKLEKENYELNEQLHNIKNNHIETLTNSITKSNKTTNNTQIIINNFPNAPNLQLPSELNITEELDKYIQMGQPNGIVKFIDKYYGSNVPSQIRSLWCVDNARNKFILRYDDAWIVDLDGSKFKELTIGDIHQLFTNYFNEKNNINNFNKLSEKEREETISRLQFLHDIVNKDMIIKMMRNLGKYLIYDKNKCDDDKIKKLTETFENCE